MTDRTRRPARWPVLVTGAALGVVCVTAGARLVAAPPRVDVEEATAPPAVVREEPADAAPPAPSVPPVPPVLAAPTAPAAVPAGTAPAAPTVPLTAAPERLRVAAADVDAPVVPVGVGAGGALELPEDAGTVGWWLAGAAPGDAAGSVVLAGHVDAAATGPGAMASLLRTPLGTVVEVADAAGTTTAYRLVERVTLPKDGGLPDELFAADGPPRLVLITCGGTFDRRTGHYSDNVVLLAEPVAG